jgi:hypothetical protein
MPAEIVRVDMYLAAAKMAVKDTNPSLQAWITNSGTNLPASTSNHAIFFPVSRSTA